MSALHLGGKVVLVTGAAQGIGLAMARGLYGRGARVVLVDRDEALLETAADRIDGGGSGILAVPADVTERPAMTAAVERAVEHFGGLDVVIANAGVTPPPATIANTDPAEFERVVDINLIGVLNTVQPAIEAITRSHGHVVVVSSSAAFCPGIGGAAYMSSKAASEQFGRALRLELAPFGATGSVAYFGFVDTELARNTLDRDPLGTRVGELLPWPMNRRVSAEHAASVVIRGIERRAPRTSTPRLWGGYSVLRGIINPFIDRMLVRDARVQALVRDLALRSDSDSPQQAESALLPDSPLSAASSDRHGRR